MMRGGAGAEVPGPASRRVEDAAEKTRADQPAESAFAPLGEPLFRSVWLTSLASNFGGMIQATGATWTMATLGASAQMVAAVQAATSLPILLLALWAGALADLVDRRRIMLLAQSFMLLVSGCLAFAAWDGIVAPWSLLVATFMVGCGTAVNAPAWQASVREMVAPNRLPQAVALNSMSFNIARSLGPAIGGGIVTAIGAAAAFLVNAISYVGFIVVLLRWRPRERPQPSSERIGTVVLEGIGYVWRTSGLRALMIRAALFGVPVSAMPALTPLVARDDLGGGAVTYGLLLGAFGCGAVIGGIGSVRLRAIWSAERIVVAASLSIAAGAGLLAMLTWPPAILGALMLGGGGLVLGFSTFNVGVQLGSSRRYVGRALATYQMFLFGGMAGGSWFHGFVADHFGLRVAWTIVAASSVVVAAGGRFGLKLAVSRPRSATHGSKGA